MEIDDAKQNQNHNANENENVQIQTIYDKSINIIARMKISFVQKIWFQKSNQFSELPIFNWKFLKTDQKSVKVKSQIIRKYGNKTDKLFLEKSKPKTYKPKAIHQPKQYWKNNKNWWYV